MSYLNIYLQEKNDKNKKLFTFVNNFSLIKI